MRRALFVALAFAACALSIPATAQAVPVFVSRFGSDVTGDGSIGRPFASVQNAVDAASVAGGGDVYVGPGEFNGNVWLQDGVSIHGAGAAETTLKGSGMGSVVSFYRIGYGEKVDGFTITGGSAGLGGGVCAYESSPVIKDNVITGNTASQGGGVYTYCSAPTITGNTIKDNSSAEAGGLLLVSPDLGGSVTDNTFTGNTCTLSGGGAISCWGTSPLITGNTITANSGTQAGGIYLFYAAPTIENNTISNNIGLWSGGGIKSETSSPTITNDTIVGNICGTGIGGGIYGEGDRPATIRNCIVWGNGDDLYDLTATYSAIEDGDAGVGNISVAPSFVATDSGDFRLRPDSPCIDAATATAVPSTDKLGVARPQGAGFDMGAYEYVAPSIPAAPQDPTLSSVTHTPGVWSGAAAVTVDLSGATGTVAPVAGFAISVSSGATECPAPVITHGAATTSFSFTATTTAPIYVNVATVDALGNWSGGAHFGPVLVDTCAPATSDDSPGTWRTSDVTVTLTATDGDSGLAQMSWVLSGASSGVGSSATSPAKISVAEEGTTTIGYSAADMTGNRCATQTVIVKIDKHGPEIVLADTSSDDCLANFTLSATDTFSGVERVSWRIGEEPTRTASGARADITYAIPGVHTVTYWATDAAGNESERLTQDFVVIGPTEVRMSSGSATLPTFGASFKLAGTVVSGGRPAADVRVVLQSSADGVAFADTSSTTTTTADGSFTFSTTPIVKTTYRARAVAATSVASALGPSVFALPCASVSNPVAPAVMRRTHPYTVWGYLKPRHAQGTNSVRIYKWHRSSASQPWLPKGYVTAKAADYSTYSKYSCSMRLYSVGYWRIRAYAPADSGHAASWSKGYDYVRVQ